MLGLTSGAQRASSRGSRAPRATLSRSILGAVVMASLFASLVAAPAAASQKAAVRIPSQQQLSVSPAPGYWFAEEMAYLDLVNCTRTGGWVQTDGTCKGRNSGRYSTYVKPFHYAARFSAWVSRPYAKLLADKNICTHFYGGTPLDRMHRAGYPNITNWGENIGCRTKITTTMAAILASHLFFQSEKSTNGGHWRNIKNARFTAIGIGVWKTGVRVRLVTDFVTA
ncbi:MAG: CAP domain-containing protein [Chloroflexota bacterium]